MTDELTTTGGCPVVDNQNVMTAGARGPQLLQDVWLLGKLVHFDREAIPERRMHAKGSGAYGTLPGRGARGDQASSHRHLHQVRPGLWRRDSEALELAG